MNTPIETDFKTDDLALTAFLLTQGIPLLDVVEDAPRHYIFVLSDADRCQELKRKFQNNAPAPAQELFAKRDILISEIKDKKVST